MNNLLQKLRVVLAKLGSPGAQKKDWFAWASGQLAHSFMGVVVAGGLLFAVSPLWAFVIPALSYAMLKELPDFLKEPTWATARDCVQDSLFVAAGAALAVAIAGQHDRLFFVIIAAMLAGLFIGVHQRIKK